MGLTVRREPVLEVIERVWHRSLILVVGALLLGIVVGGGGTLVTWLGTSWHKSAWRTTGTLLAAFPESMAAGFLWMIGIALMTQWNYRPFPMLWISEYSWRHYVFPLLALAMFPVGQVSVITSAVLRELDGHPFLQVARAKGVTPWRLLTHHLFRHVAYRVCTTLPNMVPWTLSGLMVVEWIFLIPGLARAVGYMLFRKQIDPYLLAGIMTVFLGISFAVHISAVLLATRLDPRTSEGGDRLW